MDLFTSLPYIATSAFFTLFLFWVIEKFLSLTTKITSSREMPIYQGGEDVDIKESRYASKIFPFTTYFLILHVVGFISATIFVLIEAGYDPINWTTVFFSLSTVYTVLVLRMGMVK